MSTLFLLHYKKGNIKKLAPHLSQNLKYVPVDPVLCALRRVH